MRLILLWLLSLAMAQPATPVPRAEVAAAILGAQREVALSASYLRHRDIAQALHRRAVAGLPVIILTSPHTYLDPASYFLGLHLAGAQLYLGTPSEYLLVVDGVPLYTGRGLGAQGPIDPVPEGERASLLARFRTALAAAHILVASPEDIVKHFWRRKP